MANARQRGLAPPPSGAAGDCRDPGSTAVISGSLVKAASSRRTPRRKRDTCIIPNSAFLIPNYLKQVFQAFLLLGFHVGFHLFLLFDNRAEFFNRFVEVFHLEHFRQDGVELNDDGFKLCRGGGL